MLIEIIFFSAIIFFKLEIIIRKATGKFILRGGGWVGAISRCIFFGGAWKRLWVYGRLMWRSCDERRTEILGQVKSMPKEWGEAKRQQKGERKKGMSYRISSCMLLSYSVTFQRIRTEAITRWNKLSSLIIYKSEVRQWLEKPTSMSSRGKKTSSEGRIIKLVKQTKTQTEGQKERKITIIAVSKILKTGS